MENRDFEYVVDYLCVLIRKFEGCHLMPYFCPAGILTCGWGSTGKDVIMGQAWTQEYANLRMRNDAIRFIRGTRKLCPNLTPNELVAIADFSYNLGLGRLQASTLRKVINANQKDRVWSELLKWVRGGGKILKGLVKRREFEAFIFYS